VLAGDPQIPADVFVGRILRLASILIDEAKLTRTGLGGVVPGLTTVSAFSTNMSRVSLISMPKPPNSIAPRPRPMPRIARPPE
jgi:hypothetical protein